MIFCGDFAFPFDSYDRRDYGSLPNAFLASPKIVNFETTLESINSHRKTKGIAISSTDHSLDFLIDIGVVGVTLANNHVKDFSYKVNSLFSALDDKQIMHTGLGESIGGASRPIMYDDKVVLNFGWEVIGCKPVTLSEFGCNPLIYDHVVNVVAEHLKAYPDRKIIIIFHWNYEFELYPQPAHRQLAKELIDMGVESVIGHHSHIIQGAEMYKGKPIIYGLGNFYLPKFDYNGYYLNFPDSAYTGLAVNITNLDSYEIYSYDNELRVSEPIPLFENENVMKVSQFSGMNDADYLLFFRKNRVKRMFLPIYKSWGVQAHINNKFVRYRQVIIDALVRLNLKRHKND